MPLIDGMKDRASLLNTAALAGLTKSDQNNLVRMLDPIRQNLNGMVVDTKEARHGCSRSPRMAGANGCPCSQGRAHCRRPTRLALAPPESDGLRSFPAGRRRRK